MQTYYGVKRSLSTLSKFVTVIARSCKKLKVWDDFVRFCPMKVFRGTAVTLSEWKNYHINYTRN